MPLPAVLVTLTAAERKVLKIRERLSAEATALRGANADAFIARLNPIITGSPGAAGLLHDVA